MHSFTFHEDLVPPEIYSVFRKSRRKLWSGLRETLDWLHKGLISVSIYGVAHCLQGIFFFWEFIIKLLILLCPASRWTALSWLAPPPPLPSCSTTQFEVQYGSTVVCCNTCDSALTTRFETLVLIHNVWSKLNAWHKRTTCIKITWSDSATLKAIYLWCYFLLFLYYDTGLQYVAWKHFYKLEQP